MKQVIIFKNSGWIHEGCWFLFNIFAALPKWIVNETVGRVRRMCVGVLFLQISDLSSCYMWSFGVEQIDNREFCGWAVVTGECHIHGEGGGIFTPLGQPGGLSLCKPPACSCDCGWQPQRLSLPPPLPPTCFPASNQKLLSLDMNANSLQAIPSCIPDPQELWFYFPRSSRCMRVIHFESISDGKAFFYLFNCQCDCLGNVCFCNKAFRENVKIAI